MKKLLVLPLLLGFTSAVNAESYWLILRWDDPVGNSLEKIEMESMEQCKEQGEIWKYGYRYYTCLKGK